MKRISIFGCGWVGKALIPLLEKNYELKASVQTVQSFEALTVKKKFLLNDSNDFYDKEFYETDIIIIAIPPRGPYLQTITSILSYLKPQTQIILLSSTSVYTQTQGEVCEEDTKNVTNVSLMLETERFLQKNHEKVLVLRLGGLMGYNRIAGKYSAGKTLEHDGYVNYIHRDDVVAIITMFIHTEVSSDVVNLVAPLHPSKKEIFEKNALAYGFTPILFLSDALKSKRVSSKKLKEKYHYTFLKKNPLYFW